MSLLLYDRVDQYGNRLLFFVLFRRLLCLSYNMGPMRYRYIKVFVSQESCRLFSSRFEDRSRGYI